MAKYTVEIHRHYTYEIEIDAKSEREAVEASRDWEIEDLEPHETNAWFTYETINYPSNKEESNA